MNGYGASAIYVIVLLIVDEMLSYLKRVNN